MRQFIIIACMLLVQTASAQIEKRSTELGKALLECRYECVQKLDTLGRSCGYHVSACWREG